MPEAHPGAARAHAALDAIAASPELHDQAEWFAITDCGTVMCFAGWVCHLNGDNPRFPAFHFTTDYITLDGLPLHVSRRAIGLLHITGAEADRLFCASEDEVPRIVRDIFGPRPATLITA